jgi:hypothetical protein
MPYLGVRRILNLLGYKIYRCDQCGSIYGGLSGRNLHLLRGPGCSSHTPQKTEAKRPVAQEKKG